MIRVLFSLCLLFVTVIAPAQHEAPYENIENFSFELDYSFKIRTPPDNQQVSLVEGNRYSSQPLPYLKVKFVFDGLPKEYFRFKVENVEGNVIKNKKFKSDADVYILDMGFSDDLKDKITSYKYTIFFLTKDKEVLSKIELEVQENGNFMLNDEFHGRI